MNDKLLIGAGLRAMEYDQFRGHLYQLEQRTAELEADLKKQVTGQRQQAKTVWLVLPASPDPGEQGPPHVFADEAAAKAWLNGQDSKQWLPPEPFEIQTGAGAADDLVKQVEDLKQQLADVQAMNARLLDQRPPPGPEEGADAPTVQAPTSSAEPGG